MQDDYDALMADAAQDDIENDPAYQVMLVLLSWSLPTAPRLHDVLPSSSGGTILCRVEMFHKK